MSNSASEALRQTSLSRMRSEMNYYQDESEATRDGRGAYIEEVIDQLHLVVDCERPLCEVAQEATIILASNKPEEETLTYDRRNLATGSAPLSFI